MQLLPQDELQDALSIIKKDGEIDNQTALRIKKKLAQEFRDQLSAGIPTNEDEAGLRRLTGRKGDRLLYSQRCGVSPFCVDKISKQGAFE
jgi:hypothetical protein